MQTLEDIDVFGRETSTGDSVVHVGDAAISNAFVTWLTAKPGDFLYDDAGGILQFLVFKQLTDNNQDYERKIINSIKNGFGQFVDLQTLQLIPDYENREWLLIIIYKSRLNGSLQKVEVPISNKYTGTSIPSVQQQLQQIEVEYIGDNLLNFVLLKVIDLPGVRLVINSDTGLWEWGQYIFINFTELDVHFNEIKTIINGA